MPVKKKLKIKKIKAPRAPRAPRANRPSGLHPLKPHTHIINVYTTPSSEPFNPSFSSQTMPFTTSTQYVSPQTIPVKVEPVAKELTTQNVFQAPFGEPSRKSKINIGEIINLDTSETDTAVVKKVRAPYKSGGIGSTKEKYKNIGRNFQNEYVSDVEGFRKAEPISQPSVMEFFTKNKI